MGIGSTGSLFVASGTDFGVDSLALIPSVDLTLNNNSIQHVYTPVTASGGNSINRVYNIGTAFTYSGALGLFYQDAELNGNTEATLQVAYHNNSTWLVTTGSTGNTTNNYITNNVSSVSVKNVTATQLGSVLPIKYNSFSAQLKDQFVAVNWETEFSESISGFYIQASANGTTWTDAGYVAAQNNKTAYDFKDTDLDFAVRYYRIMGEETTGEKTYTGIAIVRKKAENITVGITGTTGARKIRFINNTPESLDIYDLKGQLLKRMNVSQKEYLANGIPAGVYILRFSLAGEQFTKQVVL
jgi:hypothetical protein